MKLIASALNDCKFSCCEMQDARFDSNAWKDCEFSKCNLLDAELRSCALNDIRFIACDLSNALFVCDKAKLRKRDRDYCDVQFVDCNMEGVTFRGVRFVKTTFKNCNAERMTCENCSADRKSYASLQACGIDMSGVELIN